jgi:hypothetical protein
MEMSTSMIGHQLQARPDLASSWQRKATAPSASFQHLAERQVPTTWQTEVATCSDTWKAGGKAEGMAEEPVRRH